MNFDIIYCSVSRNKNIILTDYSDCTGNYQQISLLLLNKLKDNEINVIYYDSYQFYSIDEYNITYLLLATNMKQPAAFSLLDDLKQSFRRKYTKDVLNHSFSYQLKEFSSEMKSICHFYQNNPTYAKQGILNNKYNKHIEVIEIEANQLFSQEEKLTLIANKPIANKSKLDDDFFEHIRQFRERKRRRNIKLFSIILGIVISIGLFVFIYTRTRS